METALPLPVELLQIIGEALPRLSKSARTRLAVDLSGCFWGLRCVLLLPKRSELADTLLYRTGVLVDSIMLSKTEVDALNRSLKVFSLTFPPFAPAEQSLHAE
jgi:hypothetical protein